MIDYRHGSWGMKARHTSTSGDGLPVPGTDLKNLKWEQPLEILEGLNFRRFWEADFVLH